MKRGINILTALALIATAASVHAQVPVDDGVRTTFNRDPFNPVSPGIELVSGGVATPLAGLSAIGFENNCAAIDPINGDLLTGGSGFAIGWLRRVALSGTSVASEMMLMDLGTELGLKDLAYAPNGDLYTTNGIAMYVINRNMDVPVVPDPAIVFLLSGSFANAMTIDQTNGMLYVAVWGPPGGISRLISYDLSDVVGTKLRLIDIGTTPFNTELTGIACDEAGSLYVTNWDSTGKSVLRYDLGLGTLAAVPGAPGFGVNAVHYDRKTGLLHLVGAGRDGVLGDSEYYTLDPNSGVLTQITFGSNVGAPTDVMVNDLLDITSVFPRNPSAAADFTLETAAHGNAGEIAGIGVVAINGSPVTPILLNVGVCDSGGFLNYSASFTAGTFPVGTQFTITSARLDGTSLAVVPGTSATLTVDP